MTDIRVDALETCLRQVANDMDTAADYMRPVNIQIADMLQQSAAAAREVASDDGDEQ